MHGPTEAGGLGPDGEVLPAARGMPVYSPQGCVPHSLCLFSNERHGSTPSFLIIPVPVNIATAESGARGIECAPGVPLRLHVCLQGWGGGVTCASPMEEGDDWIIMIKEEATTLVLPAPQIHTLALSDARAPLGAFVPRCH